MIFMLEFWLPHVYIYTHRDTYIHSQTHTTQAHKDRYTDTHTVVKDG